MTVPDMNKQLLVIDRLTSLRDALDAENASVRIRRDRDDRGNVLIQVTGLPGYMRNDELDAVIGSIDQGAATEALREFAKQSLKKARRDARESLDEFLEGGAS